MSLAREQQSLDQRERRFPIQAAVLLEKLKIFDDEIAARNAVAARYAQGLGNVVTVPRLAPGRSPAEARQSCKGSA